MRIVRKTQRKPPDGVAHLEIQIHPADIQKGVRYLFLTRRQLVFAGLALGLYLLFLAHAAWRTPAMIGSLLSVREYRALEETRQQLGRSLEGVNERLVALREFNDSLRLKMRKVYLAYGLEDQESIGQGGYPFEPRAVPSSVFSARLAETAGLEAELREQTRVLATFLDEIQTFEADHRDQVSSTPSLSPLQGDNFVLTSPYGTRTNPFTKESDFHAGIDLAAPTGTPVYAPADGRVNFASRYSVRQSVAWWRYGNLVSIQHGDRFITLFGHLDSIAVKAGQEVRQGQLIGTVGNTGWSTNPHLHYEVRRLQGEDDDYRPVDPRIYILDHRWRDEERLLVRARSAPDVSNYQPLPRRIR
ncbi:MAG: M23 family peptidase [Acidobacteria bacterium]|nr:MAG: M23 family peptidase [Acidobacteriota bacterium]REK04577.1 MAG: M23 family peptidase [Acidobacteriota bacterium]